MIFRHFTNIEGVNVGAVNINSLRYADDTVLLAESEGSLQTILNEVNAAGKVFNTKLNAKKTKTMMITKKDKKMEELKRKERLELTLSKQPFKRLIIS